MPFKVRRRKLLAMTQLRRAVTNRLSQLQRQDLTDVENFYNNHLKIANRFFRFIWLAIGISCNLTCIYNIYDRIDYYMSSPVRTNVETNTENITIMPPLAIEETFTEAMRPYWDKITNKTFMWCYPNSIRAAFHPIQYPMNFSKFWIATNVTPTVKRITLYDDKNVIPDVHFNSRGIGSLSAEQSLMQLSDKNTVRGYIAVIKSSTQIKMGTTLRVQLQSPGYCWRPSVTILIDSVLLSRESLTVMFGDVLTIAYSMKKYTSLHTRKSPCQSNSTIRQRCMETCLTTTYSKLDCWLPYMPSTLRMADCSNLSNASVITSVYDTSYNIFQTISPASLCSCEKSCIETKLFLQMDVKPNNHKKNLDVIFKSKERATTEITETFAYDIISLFVDIGGTLGLFLGLSVLSIFQLLNRPEFYHTEKYKKKHEKFNAIVDKLYKLLQNRDSHKRCNCKTTFVIFLFVVLITLTSLQIQIFISDPTQTVISLTGNKEAYLPNLIACSQGPEISNIMKKEAKLRSINECDLHLLDLMDAEFTNLSKSVIEYLWEEQKIPLQLTSGDIGVMFIKTFSGTCLQITIDPKTFVGTHHLRTLSFPIFGNESCKKNLFQMYGIFQHSNYHSAILNQLPIMAGTRSSMVIETSVLTRRNTIAQPCVNYTFFENCRLHCYTTKMLQQIACKLPFMSDFNKSACDTSKTAKEALDVYFNIILESDVKSDCNCIRPCTQVIFKFHWKFHNLHVNSYFPVVIYVNAEIDRIENIIEIPELNLVSLLCVIGNLLGITLGLSILSFLHLIFANFSKFVKYSQNIGCKFWHA